MEPEVGSVLEGKITGITKFGAFVALPDGRSGLVHISEVANTYVSDINQHVQLGQTVRVRIMSVTEQGKLNLSIKRAEQRQEPARPPRRPAAPAPETEESPATAQESQPETDQAFEDRLKKFMQEANSRIADNRIYSEHRQRGRRR